MNLNATLIAQFVVFFILATFTMKFVWPPVMQALDERAKKITDGLAAADQGRQAMTKAGIEITALLAAAAEDGKNRILAAEKIANLSADDIKKRAQAEAARIIAQAQADAAQQVSKAREELRGQVAGLAVKGVEQILKREVNASAHADLLAQLAVEL